METEYFSEQTSDSTRKLWTAFIMEEYAALRQPIVSCRCFMVFNPIGEDWKQMSIAFKTFEEAKAYYDKQDRNKYPNLRILAELSYNGS